MVHNEQHTMSMLVMFLQLDTTNLEKFCLLEVFTHLIRGRIIAKLKHIVILGYVIGCDIRKINNNTGLRIYVESQFPPSTVNQAIEECLEEVMDGTYDYRRHHRECEHLNFLTISKVRQFYRQYIHADGVSRRKLILSIAPDPTLNTIQEENNVIYSWAERAKLKDLSQPITSIDRPTLEEWLVRVFRSEEDGYQPPGEDVDQTDLVRGRDHSRSPHT